MNDLTSVRSGIRATLRARIAGEAGSMTFDAFISYSHAADGRLAPALQHGMQRLAKPWYRPRAIRVFRDESALSANPHLWSSIESALDDASWLVLLASPDAVASEWVNRELDHWLATKSPDRILVVVTDGTWTWEPTAHELSGSAVPPALRRTFAAEPRHVDVAWARSETDLDLRNSRFRDAVAQLAAPVHGIAKDELEGEDIRLHRRARRLARGGASLLALTLALSVALATLAIQQREQAQRNATREKQQAELAQQETRTARLATDRAQRALNVSVAASLVVQSADALRNGQTDLGLLLAVQAQRLDPSRKTRTALLGAVVDQPALALDLHGLARADSAVFSADGHLLAAGSVAGIQIWDLRTGRPLRARPSGLADFAQLVGFADNGRTLVAETAHYTQGPDVRTAKVLDVTTGKIVESITLPSDGFVVATATGAPELIATDSAGAALFNTRTGQLLRNFSSASGSWALSADGTVAAAFDPGGVARIQAWSTQTGLALGPGCTHTVGFSDAAIEYADVNLTVAADDRTVRGAEPDGPADSGNGIVLTCDVPNGHATFTVMTSGHPARSLAGITPDNHYIITRDALGDGSLIINDPTTGDQVGPVLRAPSDRRYMQGFLPVVFSPDGRLMTAPDNDGTLRVWNVNTFLPPIATVSTKAGLHTLSEFGHPGAIDSRLLSTFANVNDANVSDDGRFVAIMTNTQLVLYDAKRSVTQSLPLQQLGCPQFDPIGIWVSLRGLGIGSAAPAMVIGCTSIRPTAPTTEKGGSLIYIDASGPHWSIASPVDTRVFTDNLLFSHDGRWLVAQSGAASDEGRLQVFRVTNDRLVPGPTLDAINDRPFLAPDSGGFIIRHNGRISRWEFANAKLTDLQISSPGDPVAVSADGKYLAIVNSNQPRDGITLWDVQTKTSSGTLPLGTDADTTVAFSAGERSVVVGQQTRTTWDLEPNSWIRDACTVADRNLTNAEWAAYLPGIPTQVTCPGLS